MRKDSNSYSVFLFIQEALALLPPACCAHICKILSATSLRSLISREHGEQGSTPLPAAT